MKALAARTRDIDDLRLLAGMIGIETPEAALQDMRGLLPRRTDPAKNRRSTAGTLRLIATP